MEIKMEKEVLLKVGEVSKKIGMSVRALHHYDEIGLLSPSHRSLAGYRLYTVTDLMQLQKIKSLQQLGFSLEDIQKLLANKEETPLLSIVQKHLEKLSYEIEQQQVLIQRLQFLAHKLAQNEQPSVEVLYDSLKETIMYEKYYTADQLKELAERRKQLGDNALQAGQQEWVDIFDKFKKFYETKMPVSSPEVQVLAKRGQALIDQFTGGNPAMEASLQKMYESEGGDQVLKQMGMDRAIFAYFREAVDLVKAQSS